jgi:hypothetical protein
MLSLEDDLIAVLAATGQGLIAGLSNPKTADRAQHDHQDHPAGADPVEGFNFESANTSSNTTTWSNTCRGDLPPAA